MARNSDNASRQPDRRFAYLDELHLVGIERCLAREEYVSAEDLAAALRKHGSRPIPLSVLEYLCRLLQGEVAKPKGRKELPELEKRRYRMIIRHAYKSHLSWLHGREARYGHLEGWPAIRQASWWQGPPHERAARMVAERFGYGAESWRSILNQASSQK